MMRSLGKLFWVLGLGAILSAGCGAYGNNANASKEASRQDTRKAQTDLQNSTAKQAQPATTKTDDGRRH